MGNESVPEYQRDRVQLALDSYRSVGRVCVCVFVHMCGWVGWVVWVGFVWVGGVSGVCVGVSHITEICSIPKLLVFGSWCDVHPTVSRWSRW